MRPPPTCAANPTIQKRTKRTTSVQIRLPMCCVFLRSDYFVVVVVLEEPEPELPEPVVPDELPELPAAPGPGLAGLIIVVVLCCGAFDAFQGCHTNRATSAAMITTATRLSMATEFPLSVTTVLRSSMD